MPMVNLEKMKVPEPKIEGPTFTKRKERDRRQVRFWAKADLYRDFTKAVEKEGLFLQDTFEDLMKWFISQSAQNKVNVK